MPPPATFQRSVLRWLTALLLLLAPAVDAQQVVGPTATPGQWEVLEGCRLAPDTTIDGDSFHLQHKGREYIVRLYFVDTPETDPSLADRALDQAAYFGIAPADIVRGGELARKFTMEKLQNREFTVVTRWQNAMGRSSLARFYGIVLVQGKNLADELVAAGLARIYGLRANWPEGTRSATTINRLKNLELEAREKRLGLWNGEQFSRAGQTTDAARPAEATADPRMDLNEATYEELQKLPGIGPVIAERIMARRPFAKVDDLEKVRGIGPKTMENLRPLVRVEEPEDH